MNQKVLLVALMLLPISSCTILPEIVLFNNANDAMTVSVAGDSFQIKPGKIRKIGRYPVKTFQIQVGDNQYSYSVEHWPENYAYFTGWWIFVDRKIKAQFNVDGNIFVLTENQTPPVSAVVDQPTGFPLIPHAM